MEANFSYMLAAFAIIWLAVFVYVFFLSRRQNRLRREIEQLKTSLRTEKK